MSRCLLHKTKLDSFKRWLHAEGIDSRAGRGNWQVLQVRVGDGWQVIYERIKMPEHFTVPTPLEPLVRRFIEAEHAAPMT